MKGIDSAKNCISTKNQKGAIKMAKKWQIFPWWFLSCKANKGANTIRSIGKIELHHHHWGIGIAVYTKNGKFVGNCTA